MFSIASCLRLLGDCGRFTTAQRTMYCKTMCFTTFLIDEERSLTRSLEHQACVTRGFDIRNLQPRRNVCHPSAAFHVARWHADVHKDTQSRILKMQTRVWGSLPLTHSTRPGVLQRKPKRGICMRPASSLSTSYVGKRLEKHDQLGVVAMRDQDSH